MTMPYAEGRHNLLPYEQKLVGSHPGTPLPLPHGHGIDGQFLQYQFMGAEGREKKEASWLLPSTTLLHARICTPASHTCAHLPAHKVPHTLLPRCRTPHIALLTCSCHNRMYIGVFLLRGTPA